MLDDVFRERLDDEGSTKDAASIVQEFRGTTQLLFSPKLTEPFLSMFWLVHFGSAYNYIPTFLSRFFRGQADSAYKRAGKWYSARSEEFTTRCYGLPAWRSGGHCWWDKPQKGRLNIWSATSGAVRKSEFRDGGGECHIWQNIYGAGLAVSRYKIWELGRTLCPGVNNMSLYVIFGHNTKPSHFCRAGQRPDGKVGTDKWTLDVIQSKSVIWPSDPRSTLGEGQQSLLFESVVKY